MPRAQSTRTTWGGARAGAGRPRREMIASEPHKRRPNVSAAFPIHVTCRFTTAARGFDRTPRSDALASVTEQTNARARASATTETNERGRASSTPSSSHRGRRSLRADAPGRKRAAYAALDRAITRTLSRADFRVVLRCLHRDRVELVVESDDRVTLARGMQGLLVSVARRINAALGRAGQVFADRYRPRALLTRSAVRAATASVRSLEALPAHRIAWPETSLLVRELDRSLWTSYVRGP